MKFEAKISNQIKCHLSNVIVSIHFNINSFENPLYFCNIIEFEEFEDVILHKPLYYCNNVEFENVILQWSL